MTSLATILSSLGLNDMESKVFALCTEFGMLPASTIAKRLGVPRTTVYNHINSLLQQQFLVTHTDAKGMMYSAIDPDMLILLLQKRTKQTQLLIEQIENIKPALYAHDHTSSTTPKIKYYQGQEAVDLIYDSYQKST
jgi:sugar-specific transcriptional regulator TrmB